MSEIMLMLIKSDGEDEDENEEHVLVALDNDNYDGEYEDNDLRGSRLLVDPLGCSRLTPPPSCKSLASTRAPPPPSCKSLESSAISLPAALLDSRDSRVPGPAAALTLQTMKKSENWGKLFKEIFPMLKKTENPGNNFCFFSQTWRGGAAFTLPLTVYLSI